MVGAFLTLAALVTLPASHGQDKVPKPPVLDPKKPIEAQPEGKKPDETKVPDPKTLDSKTADAKDEKKEKTVDEKIGEVATVASDAKAGVDVAKSLGDTAWMLVATAFVML